MIFMIGDLVNQQTVLVRNPQQLFSIIDEEVVMLSINNGEYYSLNEVGSNIWDILEQPTPYCEIIRKLTVIYDATVEQIDNDTLPYLLELIEKNIVLVKNE
jgi:hypothetical protein